MKLITEELKKQIPKLYSQEEKGENAIAYCKFFTPDSSFTWYVTESSDDNEETMFFGLVDGLNTELGYFSLEQLKSVRGPFGLAVERDLHFQPTSLAEIKKKINAWT